LARDRSAKRLPANRQTGATGLTCFIGFHMDDKVKVTAAVSAVLHYIRSIDDGCFDVLAVIE
jgi:hypothetical protein